MTANRNKSNDAYRAHPHLWRVVNQLRRIFGVNSTRKEHEHVQSVPTRRVVIFKSELDYILNCILDYPTIETGGQLFGYWTATDVPVVVYAIGSGPKANHQKRFFNQDVEYLVNEGKFLKSKYGLRHIGEWHSHHSLGLAEPSRHDTDTMTSVIKEKNIGQFLLCIGNIRGGEAVLGPYLCNQSACSVTRWDVISAESPVRMACKETTFNSKKKV